MPPSAIDPSFLAALKSKCPYLGGTFEYSSTNRLLATSHDPPRLLFAKCSTSLGQVIGEAASLAAIEGACSSAGLDVEKGQSLIPKVHVSGETADHMQAFLCTDYLDLSNSLSSKALNTLGTKLALMHSHGTSQNGKFGFNVPTHCGDTQQDNTWTESWADFWSNRRIGETIRRINRLRSDADLTELEKEMREHVYPLLLDTLKDVKPTLLHGDLWNGNAGQDRTSGEPIIFDPSSYYGHNEAELGIMKMFGGFGADFLKAYHAVLPKSAPVKYYPRRIELYELYHHLNHALLFGGGAYLSGAKNIMRDLIEWAKEEDKMDSDSAEQKKRARRAEL